MKRISLIACALLLGGLAFGQKYSTKTGKISFFSSTSMEDITADNNQVTGILEASTGEMAFVVLIKSFEFEKATMQQHFNENYLHSDKHPKSTFSGKITNLSAVNFGKNGTYNVEISGKLMIHGVTKDVKEKGRLTVNGNKVTAHSEFDVELADYDIKNDKLQNISNTIKVTVNTEMTKQ